MDDNLKWHQTLFIIIVYVSWILMIVLSILRNNNLVVFSLLTEKSFYLSSLFSNLEVIIKNYKIETIVFLFEQFLKTYIGILLIYKFNPWTGSYKNFKKFDQKIAWHAGIFLLISTILTTIITTFLQKYLIQLNNSISKSMVSN